MRARIRSLKAFIKFHIGFMGAISNVWCLKEKVVALAAAATLATSAGTVLDAASASASPRGSGRGKAPA